MQALLLALVINFTVSVLSIRLLHNTAAVPTSKLDALTGGNTIAITSDAELKSGIAKFYDEVGDRQYIYSCCVYLTWVWP